MNEWDTWMRTEKQRKGVEEERKEEREEGQLNSKDLIFKGNHPSKEENEGLRRSGQAGRQWLWHKVSRICLEEEVLSYLPFPSQLPQAWPGSFAHLHLWLFSFLCTQGLYNSALPSGRGKKQQQHMFSWTPASPPSHVGSAESEVQGGKQT